MWPPASVGGQASFSAPLAASFGCTARRRNPTIVLFLRAAMFLVLLVSEVARSQAVEVDGDGSATSGCSMLDENVYDVANSLEAAELSRALVACAGAEFKVFWQDSVVIDSTFEVVNGSRLTIQGSTSNASVVDGAGKVPLFEVNDTGSRLVLQGMELTGGQGHDGGAIAARHASITLVDCEVRLNAATSTGGAIYLQDSALEAGGCAFLNNSANLFGGAIYARDGSTVVTSDDMITIFDTNSAKCGGGVYLHEESGLSFAGTTDLWNNQANILGGGVYADSFSPVIISGRTSFMENSAGNNGGAIYASDGSAISIAGNTSFSSNHAVTYGGAVMVSAGATVKTSGQTTFTNNSASGDGGAIQSEFEAGVTLTDTTTLLENSAANFGGAINSYLSVTVDIGDETRFVGNSAGSGGGVNVESSTLTVTGETYFESNTAISEGGGVRAIASVISISGTPKFNRNVVVDGPGGGMYVTSSTQVTIRDAWFINNVAVWGGGVASFSSGTSSSSSSSSVSGSSSSSSSSSSDSSHTSSSSSGSSYAGESSTGLGSDSDGPMKFIGCVFDYNHAAEDGGGIYSVAGFDIVRRTNFTANVAESSGGGIAHSGVLSELSESWFTNNSAGDEGPAVLSLGQLSEMRDVVFDHDHTMCDLDFYGSEVAASANKCRFTIVCARCADECDSDLQQGAVTIPETVPICTAVPTGATTPRKGATVESLMLQPGFYRTSLHSTVIEPCLQPLACKGGKLLNDYCADGYTGPYCAVCTDNYGLGYAHKCNSCVGNNKTRAIGGASVVIIVSLAVVTLVISRLVAVVDVAGGPNPLGPWGRRMARGRALVRKTFPLNAVKIVVVVWQIVTQYTRVAGVEYPGAYNDFLAVIDLVNLDLGFILSFACIYDTTFYDRLLIATLGPIATLAALVCIYWIARRRNGHSEEAMSRVKHMHLSVALFVMFVVYSTVSYTIFQTFACEPMDDENSYLRADYSITCYTAEHRAYEGYAGVMVVVYPVGIPAVFGWWLFKHRHALASPERESIPEVQSCSDLWQPYKRDRFYYEVVECFRRVALTGLAVFIYPDSSAQIAIVLLLSAIFMVISEILAPFNQFLEMWLYRTGHYVVFASMYLSLLLRVDVSDEKDQSQAVFSGVVVIAHAAMLLIVIVQGLLMFFGWSDFMEAPSILKRDKNEEAPQSPTGVESFREPIDASMRGSRSVASSSITAGLGGRGKLSSAAASTTATSSSKHASGTVEMSPYSTTDCKHSSRESMSKWFNDDDDHRSNRIVRGFASQPGPKSTFFPDLSQAESAEMFTTRGRGRDTANPADLLRVAPGTVYTARRAIGRHPPLSKRHSTMPASYGEPGDQSQGIHERVTKAASPVTRVWLPVSYEKRPAMAQKRTGSPARGAVTAQTDLWNSTGGSGMSTRALGDVYPGIIDRAGVRTAPEDATAHSLASANAGGGEETAENTYKSARELKANKFGACRPGGTTASAATTAAVPTMWDESAKERTRSMSAETLGSVPQPGGRAATSDRACEGSGLAVSVAAKNRTDPAGEGTTHGVEGKDRSQPPSRACREIWEDYEHKLDDSPSSSGRGGHGRETADVKPNTRRFAIMPRVFRASENKKNIGGIAPPFGAQSATRPSGKPAGRNAGARGDGKPPKIQTSASWAAEGSNFEFEDGLAPRAGLKQEHILRRRAPIQRRSYSHDSELREGFDLRERSDLSSRGIWPAWLRDPSNVQDHAQARETNQSGSAIETVGVDSTQCNSDLFVGVSTPETKRSGDGINSVGTVLAPCASDLPVGMSSPETKPSGDGFDSHGVVLSSSNSDLSDGMSATDTKRSGEGINSLGVGLTSYISDLSVGMGAPDTKRSGDGINSFGMVLTPSNSDLSASMGAPDTNRSGNAINSAGAALASCNSELSVGMSAARRTISMQYGALAQLSGPCTASRRSFFDETWTPSNSDLSIGMTGARQSHMLQDYAFACVAKGDRLDSDSAVTTSGRNAAREKYKTIAEEGAE